MAALHNGQILVRRCMTLLLILTSAISIAQVYPRLPSVNALTPEAASLTAFADIPINYYSGIPSIGVPIYSIKSLDNTMDISIGYHAGGIKVDEEASIIGLGWTLNVGGMITEVAGTAPDISDPGPCNTTLGNSTSSFFYSFDQFSGTFYINNQTGKGITIKQEDLDIQQLSPSGSGFKITTPDGYVYMFTEKEVNVGIFPNTATWKLTSITSPNNNVITFEYESAADYDFQGLPVSADEKITNYVWTLTYCQINGVPGTPQFGDEICYPGPTGEEVQPSSIRQVAKIKTAYLKRILYNNGTIEFNYEDRDDLNYPGTIVPKRLKEIIINSKINNSIKPASRYSFQYDYTDYNNQNTKASKRLRLRELRQYSSENTTYIAWLFNYNSVVLPVKTSKDRDHWGFYNGPVNNQEFFPVSGANREPNENYVIAGMLQSITYPTGGQTQFEFESNDYSNRGSTGFKKGGGVRIKRMTTTDGITNMIKRFDYTQPSGGTTVSSGKLIYAVNYSVPRGILHITRKCYGTRPQYSPTCGCYVDIDLEMIFEYGITYTSNFEKPKQPLYIGEGAPVNYSKVTVYEEGSSNTGRTVYEFINDEAPPQPNPLYNGFEMPIARNDNGQLLKKVEEQFNQPSGAYFPVKMEEHEYENVNTKYIATYRQKNVMVSASYNPTAPPCQTTNLYVYNWGVKSDWTRLKKTINTDYSSLNALNATSTTTFYTYKYTSNPLNFLVSKIDYTNSKQQTVTEEYKYPEDFSSTNPVYQNLVSRSIYAPVIETRKIVNGTEVSNEKNTYTNDWFPVLGLQKNEQSLRGGTLSRNFNVNSYGSKGNITSLTDKEGIPTSTIWGGNSEYPVAKIINADNFNIGYTSFEPDESYNTAVTFSLGSPVTMSPIALTGRHYYNLSSSNLFYSSDLSGIKIISYWSRNGQYSVGGTLSVKQGATVNGWTYFEHRSNSNFFSISGSGAIDEVRIYPETAQMATFNYEPGVGLISQCDANNQITYYEYDAYNRLAIVRDQDKNIVKRICYNYAGQPENCNYFGNQALQQTFTKTNCPAGYSGTTGTYSVPANTYFSPSSPQHANSKAQEDMDLNGQNYVNNNPASGAVCLPGINATNTTSTPYTVTFTNSSTGAVFTFSSYPSVNPVQIGSVPQGTYTVQFTPYSTITSQITLNGVSQTGTTITFVNQVVNGPVTITMALVSGGPCSFTMNSGYSSPTNSVSASGSVVSFYLVFYSTSAMTAGNSYSVATINGGCKPSQTRYINTTISGRSWSITIYPSGQMTWTLVSGPTLNPYSTVGTSTLSFNL